MPTQARSAMNTIELHDRENTICSPTFKHPDGGNAKNIYVSRNAFIRFFGLNPEVDPAKTSFDDRTLVYIGQEFSGLVVTNKPGVSKQFVIVHQDFGFRDERLDAVIDSEVEDYYDEWMVD